MVDIDLLVAKRIRVRRRVLGLTLMDVAEAAGLAYQQVHRYEIGANRVAASVLWQLAEALQVDPNYFFADLMAPGEDRHIGRAAYSETAPRAH